MPDLRHVTTRPRARDIAESLAFLTRIPVPTGPPRGIPSAWAWPLVGALLGLGAAAVAAAALRLGLGPEVAAALALVALALLTGGLHEDGLADCADGFWGGRTRERRLAIMRDSRVGSYGVLALALGSLLRWSLLAALLDRGAGVGPLVAAATLGRLAPLVLLALLPPVRADGLGAAAGRPGGATLGLAAAVAMAVVLLAAGPAGLAAVAAGIAATAAWGTVAHRKIGGQTGDVCGAAVILAEIAALVALLALA